MRQGKMRGGSMARSIVGIIGLGIMGSAMAGNLLRAGFRVIGYDPVAACRNRHRKAGGIVAESVLDVARSARIVISSLPSAEALAGVAREISGKKSKNLVIIETSTLPLQAKEAARRRLAAAGVTLLDCPLSGTGAQARVKDLVVYASGDRAAFKRTIPVLDGFSRGHYYVGRFGNGSKMKFAANLLVAIHNVSTAEAVLLARRSGLDPALAVKVLGDGAGSSRMLQVRGPLMVRRSYLPATVTNETWRKDMKIIGEFVRRLKSPAPLFNATKAIYARAMALGFAKADTAVVCAVLERTGRSSVR
jgi:3-hydroxyisobutyrate dehydrogenase-like beta-hydroxyacid dehydrogenase